MIFIYKIIRLTNWKYQVEENFKEVFLEYFLSTVTKKIIV